MINKCCKTCKWLWVELDAASRRVVRNDRVYPCTFPIAWPPLPDSITRVHGFRLPTPEKTGMRMAGDDGVKCETWEEIKR